MIVMSGSGGNFGFFLKNKLKFFNHLGYMSNFYLNVRLGYLLNTVFFCYLVIYEAIQKLRHDKVAVETSPTVKLVRICLYFEVRLKITTNS